MKDNFSIQSDNYAKYRPTYPVELYEWIRTVVNGKQNAWDCGTGNGQVAIKLAKHFDKIFATDISQQQLDEAVQHSNINYSLQPAEKTNFQKNFFDLIIVAQAIHWFHFDAFYKEVNRTLKPGGILMVVGYNRPVISHEVDAIITHFYVHTIGPYWDKERKYIDEKYQTIPFPFKEMESPALKNTVEWTFEHLIGYLQTWSAVKHFTKAKGDNPVQSIYNTLKTAWGNVETKKIQFPLLLRTGRK